MRLKSGYENRRARVEMIPLIDVVFLLLVFFMYAMLSMTIHRGLVVELPKALNAPVDQREYVSVTVTEKNEIYVQKERVSREKLVERVLAYGGGEGKKPVFVNGAEKAHHGTVVRVLDLLRGAGIREVTIESVEEAK